MITLFLALLASAGAYVALHYAADWSILWSVISSIGVFFVIQFIFGLFIRRRLMAEMQSVQLILAEGQKKIQAKVQRWQLRPPGSIQAAPKEIADDMRVFVKEALAAAAPRFEKADTKGHLRAIAPRGGRQPEGVLDRDGMREAKLLFGNLSDAEINALYRRVTKSNH